MTPRLFDAWKRLKATRLQMQTETLILVSSLFFALACNQTFLSRIVQGQSLANPLTWAYLGAAILLLTALHFILLGLFIYRPFAKATLAIVIGTAGAATYFVTNLGVYMNVDMVRNVLETDARESFELLTPSMIPYFLGYIVLPLLMLSRIEIQGRSTWKRSLFFRTTCLAAAIAVAGGSILSISRDFVPKMRENKEWRHLITPANYIVSLIRLAAEAEQGATMARESIGTDAKLTARTANDKPLLLVLVVGETVRAQNWGLNGYPRDTTPELRQKHVINFSDVSSCGTNTAVSLPCMFSAYGRQHYDEQKIRHSESVLNVMQHAGMRALWRDNQSGCKGACTGIEAESPRDNPDSSLCNKQECFDEILLKDIEKKVSTANRDTIMVFHQMGNHGPAYHLRYPQTYARFQPVCETSELGTCSREQIVNAYDNAVLYTDHFLAETITRLQSMSKDRATAMIYLSDHGESLGENGLYLHSLPRSFAPKTQTRVPMIMWFSDDFRKQRHLDIQCLSRRATQPASHDNLFHTLLGLSGISTSVYQKNMDLSGNCRK